MRKKKSPSPKTYQQGQGGPKINLPWSKLNSDQKELVLALDHAGKDAPMTIAELTECFVKKSRRHNLYVRNALRGLVRGDWVVKVKPGLYRIHASAAPRIEVIASDALKKRPKAVRVPREAKPREAKPRARSRHTSSGLVYHTLASDLISGLEGKNHDVAAMVMAIADVGMSSTKIESVTGLSRGFLIPRLKRLAEIADARDFSKPITTDVELRLLVEIAAGRSGSGVGRGIALGQLTQPSTATA